VRSVETDYAFAGRPPHAAAKGDEPCEHRQVQGELCVVRCGWVMVIIGVAATCLGRVMQVQQRFQGQVTVCADAINV